MGSLEGPFKKKEIGSSANKGQAGQGERHTDAQGHQLSDGLSETGKGEKEERDG